MTGKSRRAAAFALALAFAPSIPQAARAETAERVFAREDYGRAARAFLRRAEAGDPAAQTYLGFMFANGRGEPQSFAEAARWLRRAADRGYPTAQFLLGQMYDKGHGVPQDFVEAEFWLDLAAAAATPVRRDFWTRIRDAVANKLSRDELADAQRRALAWTPAAFR